MSRTIVLKTRPMLVVEQRIGEPMETFLERRYTVEGKTQREIAAELGIHETTVTRWMAQLRIEARFPGPRARIAV